MQNHTYFSIFPYECLLFRSNKFIYLCSVWILKSTLKWEKEGKKNVGKNPNFPICFILKTTKESNIIFFFLKFHIFSHSSLNKFGDVCKKIHLIWTYFYFNFSCLPFSPSIFFSLYFPSYFLKWSLSEFCSKKIAHFDEFSI